MKKLICIILALTLISQNSFASIVYKDLDEIEETTQTIEIIEETTVSTQKETKQQKETKAKSTETTKNSIENTTATNKTKNIAPAEKQDITKTAEYQAILAEIQKLEAELANSSGQVAYNTQNTNIQTNESIVGQSIQGSWYREEGYWTYYTPLSQKIKNTFLNWNGKDYYLDDLGHMSTGWKYITKCWYLFSKTGEMIKGWYNDGLNWYYLYPDSGKMANQDAYIDGEIEHFTKDGIWIKDVNDYSKNEFVTYIKSIVKYVDNKTNLKIVSPDSELKKQINTVIESLPKETLARMGNSLEQIYICVKQNESNRKYLKSISYKDEDGDKMYEELPFDSTKRYIYINGDNAFNLYYGIGEFLGRTMTYQQTNIANTSVWKVICSNQNEEIDNLMSLTGDNNLIFYTADTLTTLACTIGWYLINPILLQEVCAPAYNYVSRFVDITVASPLLEW